MREYCNSCNGMQHNIVFPIQRKFDKTTSAEIDLGKLHITHLKASCRSVLAGYVVMGLHQFTLGSVKPGSQFRPKIAL